MSDQSSPPSPKLPEKLPDATAKDILLSLFIPLYGGLAGLISVSNGNAKRGRTMAAISTVQLLIIIEVSRYLQ